MRLSILLAYDLIRKEKSRRELHPRSTPASLPLRRAWRGQNLAIAAAAATAAACRVLYEARPVCVCKRKWGEGGRSK
jgi:hypothetical protein